MLFPEEGFVCKRHTCIVLHPFCFHFSAFATESVFCCKQRADGNGCGSGGAIPQPRKPPESGIQPEKGRKRPSLFRFFKKITGRGLFVVLFFAHFRPNTRFSCAKWLTFLVLYVKIEQKKRSCPYRFATEYGFCCSRRRKRLFLFFR